MVAAESILIQFSQRQQFREDTKALQKGKQVSRKSQLLKLDPILQDGTLRVGGRLNKSAMPENVNNPAVLSNTYSYTKEQDIADAVMSWHK